MLVALIAILACLPAGASAHLDFASSSPTGGSAVDAPVERVTGADVPMPYAENLEQAAVPSVANISYAVRKVCGTNL